MKVNSIIVGVLQPGFHLFRNGADVPQVLGLGRPQRERGLEISATGRFILYSLNFVFDRNFVSYCISHIQCS